jgi:Radical SAM superfamily/4Fe-4S single cluster domain
VERKLEEGGRAESGEANGLAGAKFRDPWRTATGEPRAWVTLNRLKTLWFNTGTLCNLTCRNCYIESSPTNDGLVYLSAEEVRDYLDETERERLGTEEVGFTGGEPFMNPAFPAMLEDSLRRGFRVLVLTNAMRPMMKLKAQLLGLRERFQHRLVFRVSLDHYSKSVHELERGPRTWEAAIAGLTWLAHNGFIVRVAGRGLSGESEAALRDGYARLLRDHCIAVDASDPEQLVIFPEMDAIKDVPEITTACWGILDISPDAMMCASSRMVIKRRGAAYPIVVSCTLLPYGTQFELGRTLTEAMGSVPLNHPHCARFCVLGGGSCSGVRS